MIVSHILYSEYVHIVATRWYRGNSREAARCSLEAPERHKGAGTVSLSFDLIKFGILQAS